MVAINQKLHDDFIRHGVRLVGYENGVANRVAKIWAEGAREATDIIESRGRDVERRDRDLLLQDLTELVLVLIVETETLLSVTLLEQTQTEQRVITKMLWNAFPASVLENVGGLHTLTEAAGPISSELLRPIKLTTAHRLVNSPIHGKAWPARVKGLKGAMAGKLRRQLAVGMAHGESIPKISRRVRNVFKSVGGRRATLIAQTEVHNVSNRVHDEMFKKNRKLLNGVEYTSTLDIRTCPVCGSYDRNQYFFDGKPAFASRPFIPQHPKCRCVYIPITKFKEIFGLDLKPGQRASMFGPVKADANFGQWLKRQPISVAEQVLGKAKARLFHDGVLHFDQFVNRGQVLNLKQLEKLMPAPVSPELILTPEQMLLPRLERKKIIAAHRKRIEAETLKLPVPAKKSKAELMKEAREKYGIQAMPGKAPTIKELEKATEAMGKIPNEIHKQIVAQKRGVDLVKNHGVTVHPKMMKYKGIKVSKYKGETSTWDLVTGCGPGHKSKDNAIITINRMYGRGQHTIMHEHAHLYDSVMGNISNDPRWQAVWRTEMSKMHWTTYYSKDYADEAFAECYVRYFQSPRTRLMLSPKTRKYFDDMVALAKRARK